MEANFRENTEHVRMRRRFPFKQAKLFVGLMHAANPVSSRAGFWASAESNLDLKEFRESKKTNHLGMQTFVRAFNSVFNE